MKSIEELEELFIDIAKKYDTYDDIKDRIRGLHSYGELTDEEYNYILDEWDNMLLENNL